MNSPTALDDTHVIDDLLLQRMGDLKRELVAFAEHNRFGRAFRQMLEQQTDETTTLSEFFAVNIADHFALQHRLHDGSTVLERFVAQHRKLSDDEQSTLLGWHDVVQGVFEVQNHDDGALVTTNLVDDLPYRIFSNFGRDLLNGVPDEGFLIARIVPFRDAWLLSGAAHVFPAEKRSAACHMAVELSVQFPAAVFRNPAKLERAWQIQGDERRMFIEFFGSDLIVTHGSDFAERMQAFMHYRTYEAHGADAKTAAERVRERRGEDPKQVEFAVPDFSAADTVAAIYDDVEGLKYLVNFGSVEEAFTCPDLVSTGLHRDAVLGYLEDDTVSPLPFRRLAARDPEAANQVFRTVLDRADFEWARDGEALMRQYKTDHLARPVLPSVSVISDSVADGFLDHEVASSM